MIGEKTDAGNNLKSLSAAATRRQVLTYVAGAFGSFTLHSLDARAAPAQEIVRNAEAIHQEPVFKASPQRVYQALTDPRQFDRVVQIIAAKEPRISLAKSPTRISREVGGAFSLFGGIIVGRHVEMVPNQRLVQAWRVAYWAPGIYSIAKFELLEQGSETKIIFDHTGFPQGRAQDLASGWKAHYWEPLAQFLSSPA